MVPPIRFVSMCGNWLLGLNWFKQCAKTWSRLIAGETHHILSDGGFTTDSCNRIGDWSGSQINQLDDSDAIERDIRLRFPSLSRLRDKCVFIRRITDLPYHFDRDDYVLSFDTDIYFRQPVRLPSRLPDFVYCIDEVAGYTGNPWLALQVPLLRSLNGGFLLFRPGHLDLDRLELLASRYLGDPRRTWWIEQTAWGLLGANVIDRGIFSPNSVDIVSGFRFRSKEARLIGKTKYFTLRRPVSTKIDIETRIAGVPIIHFAGPGKPWIAHATRRETNDIAEIEILSAPTLSSAERLLLFLRLSAQR